MGDHKTLKMAIEVRWNSLLNMLRSINDSFDKVKSICIEKKKMDLLVGIDPTMLKELVEMLTPFEDVTKIFEKSRKPTIHEVIYCRVELVAHLQPQTGESPEIREIKLCLLEELLELWHISSIHIAAVIIDPIQKSSLEDTLCLDKEEISRGVDFIWNLIERAPNLEEPSGNVVRTDPETLHGPKRIKMSGLVEKFRRSNENQTVRQKFNQEFASYIDHKFSVTEIEEYDVLDFWRRMKTQYKLLTYAAQCILATPASSAKSESDFSITGKIKTKSRASLKPSTLNSLLVIRTNKDLCSDK